MVAKPRDVFQMTWDRSAAGARRAINFSLALVIQVAVTSSAFAQSIDGQEPAMWRYTFDSPVDGWRTAAFDDSGWRSGRGAFGARGTPGIRPETNWSTGDIWLRREFALPATAADFAATQL